MSTDTTALRRAADSPALQGYNTQIFRDAADELDAARQRIAELERIAGAAQEAAACSGECVMTVAGCLTHNWDDPCAMAELRDALRGEVQP
jgi:hypothetical protein